MDEEKLRKIIREKINFKPGGDYDGFKFSGYNDAHYHNLELIGRFKGYMSPQGIGEVRHMCFIIPIFWKGGCDLAKIPTGAFGKDNLEWITTNSEFSGDTTEDIIFEVIKRQNPDLLDELKR